ncbi:MAG: DUF6886 family protein [Pseudonocardiaceae bacterium]
MVSTEPVEPLGPAEPVGDLLGLYETAGIQLRVLDNVRCFWDKVTTSTLGYSGIRRHNANPVDDFLSRGDSTVTRVRRKGT